MGSSDSSDTSSDGFPKLAELFCFFQIIDAAGFREKLPTFTEKWVTTLSQQQLERTRIRDWKFRQQRPLGEHAFTLNQTPVFPLALVNIAFSNSGLSKVWQFKLIH